MDLVQTVRKEGSRGGRGEFKWDDVKNSSHRENFLGHSLMAPVGRWQKNKDLSWYAKGDGDGQQMSEEEIRKAEIKKIKEAEEDAMARALGREPPPRESENANLTALGKNSKIQKAIKEAIDVEDLEGEGVGFGSYAGPEEDEAQDREVLHGTAGGEESRPSRDGRDSRRKDRRRDGSRDRAKRREHRHHSQRQHHEDRRRRRHDGSRSRSPDRHRYRSRSRERRRDYEYGDRSKDSYERSGSHRDDRRRDRSRSPRMREERRGHRR